MSANCVLMNKMSISCIADTYHDMISEDTSTQNICPLFYTQILPWALLTLLSNNRRQALQFGERESKEYIYSCDKQLKNGQYHLVCFHVCLFVCMLSNSQANQKLTFLPLFYRKKNTKINKIPLLWSQTPIKCLLLL